MELNLPPKMTDEEIALMKRTFNDARASINRKIEELKSLAFEFNQLITFEKYDDAEKIMAKFSVMSVAMNAWTEAIPHLDEFESPFEAVAAGAVLLEKKYAMAAEVRKETT